MPRIVVSQFLTLDGVMQAPGDPEEDRDGGFDHGGWLTRLRLVDSRASETGVLLLTYTPA